MNRAYFFKIAIVFERPSFLGMILFKAILSLFLELIILKILGTSHYRMAGNYNTSFNISGKRLI